MVPVTGSGTASDPKRPMHSPTVTQTGIIAYSQQISDDGRFALVEFVARDRSVFASIVSDKSIPAFLKGDSRKDDIERELRKYKKDFDLEKFGLVLP